MSERLRIALVEDDPFAASLMSRRFERAGHSCTIFPLGAEFLRAWSRESFDLLIIDWELPDVKGPDILRWVRGLPSQRVPVLFCTARGAEADVVEMLAQGADDYLAKPVRLDELVARAAALVRRHEARGDPGVIEVGNIRLEAGVRRVLVDGIEVALTDREYELFGLLFRNLGRVLSRGHLMEAVWGHPQAVESRSMDTYMSRLRRRLSLTPRKGWSLKSSYQRGYRLEAVAVPAVVQPELTP